MKIKVAGSASEYRELIERYKVQNPVKFAKKQGELMAKLARLEASEAPVETIKVEKPKRK